ncbi:Salicylate O-methyltransferase [Apostasia shenzhenica]|uniref:Salicylate O-methyltransferase n=1 Tax=Apostasia shenzhenica TaxID=1088818 RepID=A0A2I0A4L4_9ASPA|nr:Salicylate O-methyltransferase [Apostasia shenzhenica]
MEYYSSFSLHSPCKLKRQQHLAMEIEHVLHMVGGEGENSYANNSRLQEKGIYRTRSTVEEAVRQICTSFLPEKLVVADLGCSSGPNAFLVMSEIIGAVDEHCCLRRPAGHPPEIQFFLNDLPGNDFNNTFQLLVLYRNQVKEGGKISVPFYAVGLPGSFYGRLFPSRSVHFFHSSYCLMWLSQVRLIIFFHLKALFWRED